MILSHRWRFIFIKGRKVAGTSVEMALSTLCGPDDVITPFNPRDEAERMRLGGQCRNYAVNKADEAAYQTAIAAYLAAGAPDEDAPQVAIQARYVNHMSLLEVLRNHQGDLRFYRVLAVERSPYSKVLSWANMQAGMAEYRAGRAMQASPEAIARALDAGFADRSILRVRNIDLYRGLDGHVAAPALRYTDLPDALTRALADLGAPAPPPLPHAKKGLMADTIDPRSLLRPDQVDAINALFADEFSTFGYPVLTP